MKKLWMCLLALSLMLVFWGCQKTDAHVHAYAEEVIAPTCTQGGYTIFTCQCGDTYQGAETEKLPHNYSEEVIKPTCTEGGYTIFTCQCGDTYQGAETEKTEHNYSKKVKKPTCTKGGYTVYTCQCGESYKGDKTKKTGHSYSAKVVSPTAGKQGYTLHKCKRCGVSYKDNYTWRDDMPSSFFDDAAFIGDSVTLALRNYCATSGALGKATFLSVGSYSVNNAVHNGLYIPYQGKKMTPQDALKASGAKKVFILLGMNDIALAGEASIDRAMDNWKTMLSRIRKKNPDIEIYIQSGTPIFTEKQGKYLNNKQMDAYNVELKKFAKANGCQYIDIATPMKDSTNGLASKYCSDRYVHLTQAACKLWVSILKDYVNS